MSVFVVQRNIPGGGLINTHTPVFVRNQYILTMTSEALDVVEFERRYVDRVLRTTRDYPLPAGHIDEPAGQHQICQEDISSADSYPVPDTILDPSLFQSTASIIQRSHEYSQCN